MTFIKIDEPVRIKYDLTRLEGDIEKELKKQGYSLLLPTLDIRGKTHCRLDINRSTDKPNRKGHFFTYGRNYVYRNISLYDIDGSLKIDELSKCLSVATNLTKHKLDFLERFGLSKVDANYELQEFNVIKHGSLIELVTQLIKPFSRNPIYSSKKLNYDCSKLEPAVSEIVELFTSGDYEVRNYELLRA